MIPVLVVAMLLAAASPAWALFTEVGGGSQRATAVAPNNSDSVALAFPGNVTSGNVLVVWGATWTSVGSPSSVTVTDSQGTYNVTSCTNAGNTERYFIAWRQATGTGANSVTVDPAGAAGEFSFTIDEFSIPAGDAPRLDVASACSRGVSAAPSTTIAPSANALILGVMTHDQPTTTITPGASYTQAGETENNNTTQAHHAEFRVITTSQTYTVDWTTGVSVTWSTLAISLREGVVDTQAPTTPTGLACAGQSSGSNLCAWNASTDNVGVVDYILERSPAGCGSFTAFPALTTRSYTDSGLAANTTYCYRVSARDGSGNVSIVSGTTTGTTFATRQATLRWTNNASYTTVVVERCAGANCVAFTDYATVSGALTTYVDATSATPVSGYRVRGTLTGASDSSDSNAVYTPASTPAVLSVSPPSLTYSATIGGANPGPQAFTVSNAPGNLPMVWTLSDDAAWFSCVPAGGVDTTVLSCSVNITGLSSGTQFATITVAAPGATNSPATALVTLNLSPSAAPTSGRGGRVR